MYYANNNKPKKIQKHLFVFAFVWIFFAGLVVISLLNFSPPARDMQWGATFSQKYARDTLNLDWKAAYIATLEDLKIKNLRLMSYWDEIEKIKDTYNFEDLDFMMDEAAKHNTKVILAVGLRLPRWPECHFPSWADKNDSYYKPYIIKLIQEIVKRYKDNPALLAWQVENEPLLPFFGECPKTDTEFLKKEIQLVSDTDPNHPINVTASGEFTSWTKTAQFSNNLGVSLYRVIEKKKIGNIHYPLFPAFYRWRALLSGYADSTFISELQAEPWKTAGIKETPIKEQFEQFSQKDFINQINFARATGFTKQYLWGVEWWYWLKEKNYPQHWDTAKKLIENGSLD